MPKYLELLLKADGLPYLFFDRKDAEKKADEIREDKGKRAEIVRHRDQWTVFQLSKNN